MIPTRNKFPTRNHFLQFRADAKQSTTPHLRIMISPHIPSRLSVIVPIKVNKQAVVRNSLKRLVYDNLWEILKDKNLDCLIIFKPINLLKAQGLQAMILNELQHLHHELL